VHGEVVGDWLGALGELWSASNELHDLVAASALATEAEDAERDDTNDDDGDDDGDDADATDDHEPTVADALDRTKVALVRVQELSLW
jgi:hypothetical protein